MSVLVTHMIWYLFILRSLLLKKSAITSHEVEAEPKSVPLTWPISRVLLRIEIVRNEKENVIALRKKDILIDPIGSRSGFAER